MWRHINRNYSLWRRKKNEQSFQDTIKQFDIHITGITGKKKKGRFWGTKSLRKLWLKISQFDEKYQFTGMNLETALWVCPEQFISKMGASVLGQPVLRHLLGVERKKKNLISPNFISIKISFRWGWNTLIFRQMKAGRICCQRSCNAKRC